MLRFTGKCAESARPQWSDWHGAARKKEVAETAKDGNKFEILITDFSCTLAAQSRFVSVVIVAWCCVLVLAMAVFPRERIESPPQERRFFPPLCRGHLDRRRAPD